MRAQSIGIIFLLLALISCNNKDGYSLGEFQVSMGTIIMESETSYSILLDNGKKLWPAATDHRYEAKNNQRAFVNYTLLSGEYNGYDHMVKVNAIWDILTKDIIKLTKENEEEIGNDPIKFNHIWIANDFLNIDFMFNYGGIRPHFINLVENEIDKLSEDDVVELEFRHNSYGSTNIDRLTEGLVSFNLKPLQRSDANSINIRIKVKEFDKESTYDIEYEYSDESSKSAQTETPVLVVASEEYY